MGMKNFDIKDIGIFGLQTPRKSCWYDMLVKAKDFSAVDKKQFEKSLADNVELGYYRLCSIALIDLDTDIEYIIWFFNAKRLWTVEIANVKEPDLISPEDKKKLFQNPLVQKLIARSYEVLDRAGKLYVQQVQPHVEAGELLKVDETKADAVIYNVTEDKELMKNLKRGLYIK